MYNMLGIVVISHNQYNYLAKMNASLSHLQEQGADIIYVLDRCTDGSQNLAIELDLKYVETPDDYVVGHCPGYARNIGAQLLQQNNGPCNILFLDGDRTPTNVTTDIINKCLSISDIGLLQTQNDYRNVQNNDFQMWSFSPHELDNHVLSCGILLSANIISQLQYLQSGNIFHPVFDTCYGLEDTFLGSLSMLLGARITFFPCTSYIAGDIDRYNGKRMDLFNRNYNIAKELILRYEYFLNPDLGCLRGE
jgi:hypothetical protein